MSSPQFREYINDLVSKHGSLEGVRTDFMLHGLLPFSKLDRALTSSLLDSNNNHKERLNAASYLTAKVGAVSATVYALTPYFQ